MQPFESSTIFSSCWRTPPRRTSSASTLTLAMSLTITAIRQPARLFSRWLSSVVFPAPRKPESTVTGSGPALPGWLKRRSAFWIAKYGVTAVRRHRKRTAVGRAVAFKLAGRMCTLPRPSGPCAISSKRSPSSVRPITRPTTLLNALPASDIIEWISAHCPGSHSSTFVAATGTRWSRQTFAKPAALVTPSRASRPSSR